jgi:hypothetical protein
VTKLEYIFLNEVTYCFMLMEIIYSKILSSLIDELSLLFTGALAQGDERIITTSTVIEDQEDSDTVSPRTTDVLSSERTTDPPNGSSSSYLSSQEPYSALHSPAPETPVNASTLALSSHPATPPCSTEVTDAKSADGEGYITTVPTSVSDQEGKDKATVQRLTRIHPSLLPAAAENQDLLQVDQNAKPLFTTVQLGVDRRLLVNRKRELKMYRVWMQGKFRRNN